VTVPIAPGSSRSVAAQAFARELRKAMTARKASAVRLAEASGCMKSSINSWRAANNLPQPATAARLAEALDWPKLLAISTDARRKRCPRCGASYVDATGAGNRQFCSADCRLVDSQLRKPAPAIALHDAVRAATDARLAGEAERRTLPATLDALHAYEAAARRQRDRVDAQDRRLRALVASVEAMCGGCEPEGLCRTTDCPLRPFSPLPVASDRAVAEIRKPASPHDAEHRDAWLASVRSANEARWSREGERERASETHRALHAAMSPEQREERGRRISAGRRSHMEEATA
jgi:transcriptional regulator with XRE-family HTH domain